MRIILLLSLGMFWAGPVFCQDAPSLITRVIEAQNWLKTVHYTLERTDTFTTGQTRVSRGEVKLKSLPADSLFGFAFWAKKEGIDNVTVYDGHTGFSIDHSKRSYESSVNPVAISHYLGFPGGQMVLTDLVRLDTAKATGFEVKEDPQYYYLTMHRPDLAEYDVTKRYNVFTIDKKLLLPVRVRNHQETLGKVQDLDYHILDIQVNDITTAYDFSAERFPADYTRETRGINKQLASLKDKTVPAFQLSSFDAAKVSTAQFKNKVVLLDFWEVWCGPCIASMPKVQALYDKYRSQGLEVYGMMSEKDQLETARLLVQKRKIGFPMLSSNEQVMKDFGVSAVPTYVLIDKTGNIRFTSEGFSEDLESEIKKLL